MQPLTTLKDVPRETRAFRARLMVSAVVVLCLALILIARLVKLQIIDYEHFRTLSDDNRIKVVPIAPTRGRIFDRNGVVLAENIPTYSLEVVPESVDDMDAMLAALGKVIRLGKDDLVRFRRALTRTRRFESVPLRLRLSEEEVARFAVNRQRFPGVDVQARLTRSYPLGSLAAHLVGYVGRISEAELQRLDPAEYRGSTYVGKVGVERSFERELHGTVGFQQVETNALGRTIRVIQRRDPVPGKDIYLTLDAGLQAAAERALGKAKGALVAIDPVTGGVLAFVSLPAYDPNLFVDGIDRASYAALLGSPQRPLFNRALNGQYPPGSTIKPFMGLAGLEDNVKKARGTVWCPGWFRLPGRKHRYRDWKKGGHGRVNLHKAIVESCDVYFYQLALDLGIDRIHDFLARFGFGQRTGISLKGESAGVLPSRAWKRAARGQPWYPGETVITGIGQGYMLATPLQLASATATLATGGRRLRPRVVRWRGRRGESAVPMVADVLDTIKPQRRENWREIASAMVDVVHGRHGTARRIGVGASYRIAGKTGTAQVFTIAQDKKYRASEIAARLRDHGLFIAYAPADAPRIALAVVVENGGGGSRSAAPVARKVLDAYLGTGSPARDTLMTRNGGTASRSAVLASR